MEMNKFIYIYKNLGERIMNKKMFVVKDNDGNELNLAVLKPTTKQKQESRLHYNKAFNDAIVSKSPVRMKIDSIMIEQGLWDETRQKQLEKIRNTIKENEELLSRGGVKLSVARQAALDIRAARSELIQLLAARNALDNHTAESQAENRQFDYLVSVCTVYNDSGKPYFKNYEEYINKAEEDVAFAAAQHLSSLLYGVDDDFERNLPENQFLLEYKFVDNELRLVNNDGKLINIEGRLINEDGQLINEDNQLVDIHGNLLDDTGKPIVTFVPFEKDI